MLNTYLYALILSLTLAGCSQALIYETLKSDAIEKCREIYGQALNDCLQRNNISFEDYQKERNKVLKKD